MKKVIKKAQDGTKVTPEIVRLRKKYTADAEQRRIDNAKRAKLETEKNTKKSDSLKEVYSKNPAPLPKGVIIKSKTPKAKDGKWMQKASASIKRRGTEGKCTPITKPGCTGRAKTLALTFKKMAAKRKKK